MSENKPKTDRKAPKTAFKPGQSGNPGGRPKLPEDVKNVRELARSFTQEAVNALVDVLREGGASAKVSAAQALLDRGWGKAEANINMTVKRSAKELTDDELAAIAAGSGADSTPAQASAGESGQLH